MSAVRLCLPVFCAALFCAASSARADGPIKKPSFDPDAVRVELFEGIEREQLSVRVSPRDAYSSKVFITNETDQPLTVILPEAVVAVHVLNQVPGLGDILGNQGQNAGLNAGNGQGNQGAGQSVGGVFQGQQGGPGNNQAQNPFGNQMPANGFFSIPPEKTVQVSLATVCLDHGKPDPSVRMTYELRRVEDHTDDLVLRELLRGYDPQRDQRMVLQAAAWNRANEMSWKELAAKTIRRGPLRFPLFSRNQLKQAEELVEEADETVASSAAQSDSDGRALDNVARADRRR
jgi:hypothetical protein